MKFSRLSVCLIFLHNIFSALLKHNWKNKNFRYLKCTSWWFETHIHCERTPSSIKLFKTSSTSHIYLFFFFLMRTFKFYLLSSFSYILQGYDLYSPCCISDYKTLFLLELKVCTFYQPLLVFPTRLVPSNRFSTPCFYEF